MLARWMEPALPSPRVSLKHVGLHEHSLLQVPPLPGGLPLGGVLLHHVLEAHPGVGQDVRQVDGACPPQPKQSKHQGTAHNFVLPSACILAVSRVLEVRSIRLPVIDPREGRGCHKLLSCHSVLSCCLVSKGWCPF